VRSDNEIVVKLDARPLLIEIKNAWTAKSYSFNNGGPAMPTFIMLTRLNPDAVRSPRGLEQLERDAMKRVREECPDVEWLNSYAVLGPCDYLDVFMANDIETAARVSALIRTFGHAHTEIWTATEWDRFKDLVRTLPGAA
jgi:uncharacterized protein with GYD domain